MLLLLGVILGIILLIGGIFFGVLFLSEYLSDKSREWKREAEDRKVYENLVAINKRAEIDSVKYEGSQPLIEASSHIEKIFWASIQGADRANYKKKISVSGEFGVNEHGVFLSKNSDYNCYIILFEKNNLKPLTSDEETIAFAKAIIKKIIKDTKRRFPKDISGTTYTINEELISRYFDGQYCRFKYEASNGFYKEPMEWHK